MLIPISMLWGTQMRLRRKLALAGIYSLVIITIIFAIVRTTLVSSLTRLPDTLWLYMWSAIETTIGVCTFSPLHTKVVTWRLRADTSYDCSNRRLLSRFLPQPFRSAGVWLATGQI